MKTGWKTSEFWLASHWTAIAAGAVGTVLVSPPASWPAALVVAGAVGMILWFAGGHAHNYGENRFRLKAQEEHLENSKRKEAKEPARQFGLGRFIQSETSEGDNEDGGDKGRANRAR